MIPNCIEAQVAFIAIRAYAAHSYIYYAKNENIIDDGAFDQLCKWLLANYNWVKPYDINKYLNKGALGAGTGYSLKVIGQTRDYAESMLEDAILKRTKSGSPSMKTISNLEDLL